MAEHQLPKLIAAVSITLLLDGFHWGKQGSGLVKSHLGTIIPKFHPVTLISGVSLVLPLR
jgi:hypothetical protein